MIEIKRIEGFILNPNDQVVNKIFKAIERNKGVCACKHKTPEYEGKDLHCPCTDYIKFKTCLCNLYKKV